MEEKKMFRMVFPGSNSAYGFFSYYRYIIEPQEAARIYIIKGGPGTGKSTFMRQIGEEMVRRSLFVEYHLCSSDSNSLDGIVIPSLGIAMLDGTAPHVNDPEFPGAVDAIINMGDFWEEEDIRKNKAKIMELGKEIARLFSQAYRLLHISRIYLDAVGEVLKKKISGYGRAVDQLTMDLYDEILSGRREEKGAGKIRKLFASAITPQGTVNYLDTLVNGVPYTYVLQDERGIIGDVLAFLVKAAAMRGFNVEAFYCALDPYKVDHLIIPRLGVALITANQAHSYNLEEAYRVIDTKTLFPPLPGEIEKEIDDFHNKYRDALRGAINFINNAKYLHDRLEEYYILNMRFAEIEKMRRDLLKQIIR